MCSVISEIPGMDKISKQKPIPINEGGFEMKKCGEIFVSNSNQIKFEIKCNFCQKLFLQIYEFCKHIFEHHLSSNEEDSLIENILFNKEAKPDGKEILDIFQLSFLPQKNSDFVENLKPDIQKTFEHSKYAENSENIPTNESINSLPVNKHELLNSDENSGNTNDEHFDLKNNDINSDNSSVEEEEKKLIELRGNDVSRKYSKLRQKKERKRRFISPATKAKILENFSAINNDKYRCKICNRSASKYKLEQHLTSHDDSRYTFQCKVCLKLFISETSMELHVKKFHTEEKPFKCDYKNCNKSFVDERNLREHSKYHGERPYKCLICCKEYVYERKLREHSRTHNKTRKPKRKKVLKLYSSENREIKIEETNNVVSNSDGNTFSDSDGNIQSAKRFKQKQMIKVKKSKVSTAKKTVEQVICDICGKSTSKYKLSQHLQSHDDSRYTFQCETCQKMFISEKSLENHVKAIHTKDLPFSCTWKDCSKKFVDQNSLNAHMVRHTSDRPFKCHICNKGFIYEYRRDQHVRIYHVNGRIYKCDICDKRFYEQHNLNKHKIVHSSEKPYACDECPARFLRERCLHWHKKQHSGIKDYICKICGKGYALYNGIYSHMKTHGIKYSLDYEKGLTDGKDWNPNEKDNISDYEIY